MGPRFAGHSQPINVIQFACASGQQCGVSWPRRDSSGRKTCFFLCVGISTRFLLRTGLQVDRSAMKPSCEVDYAAACPDQWILSDGHCKAPGGYTVTCPTHVFLACRKLDRLRVGVLTISA